ncbi:MAG: hypothetical protein ACREO8_06380 [Luteimonas sp.]
MDNFYKQLMLLEFFGTSALAQLNSETYWGCFKWSFPRHFWQTN